MRRLRDAKKTSSCRHEGVRRRLAINASITSKIVKLIMKLYDHLKT